MILQFTQTQERRKSAARGAMAYPKPRISRRARALYGAGEKVPRKLTLLVTERQGIASEVSEALGNDPECEYQLRVVSEILPWRNGPSSPRVVLLDMTSPRIGDAFVQAIHRHGNAPCVLITDSGFEEATAELLLAGARGCVEASDLRDLPHVLEAITYGASPVPPQIRIRLIERLSGFRGVRKQPLIAQLNRLKPVRWGAGKLRRVRRIVLFPLTTAGAA